MRLPNPTVFKQIHHLPAKYEIYSKQPPLCYSSDPEKEKKAQRPLAVRQRYQQRQIYRTDDIITKANTTAFCSISKHDQAIYHQRSGRVFTKNSHTTMSDLSYNANLSTSEGYVLITSMMRLN
uniref:Uncharacterized protein n=1 Tax=Rhizophagus irregularis (strain DAOM 181602 / DAOM 197198 / MUCL 43194) TaxID=747089 RepID=U9UP29_RHIID